MMTVVDRQVVAIQSAIDFCESEVVMAKSIFHSLQYSSRINYVKYISRMNKYSFKKTKTENMN
jgi:hypothetical protein